MTASSAEDPIRIVLADAHALVRSGLHHMIAADPGFEVLAEAGTGADAANAPHDRDAPRAG